MASALQVSINIRNVTCQGRSPTGFTREIRNEMYLAECYPGVSVQEVLDNTGFPMDILKAVESLPPSDEELRILRSEVDPQRLILN